MLSILKLAYNLEIELVFHELFFETTISETMRIIDNLIKCYYYQIIMIITQ